MRLFHEKEEMAELEHMMTKIACLIYLESKKMLLELSKKEVTEEDTDAIGEAAGQILYDDIIELTKDMPRDEVVKYFAQMAIAFSIKRMNDEPAYRRQIMNFSDEI